MKKMVWIWLMMACLPFFAFAQSSDDLYFIPKKKTEKKEVTGTPAKVVVEKVQAPTTVYASPGSTVVVKDVNGDVRDVDEYNRRYTSRDNTFSLENDTLYIEEKPYNERGEWVNGFEGSASDYEYAMRIVRFRNPRYAIPVSSPLYWEVVYTLPSWEWNVYDDGFYAYAFPTYSNSLWWNWRYDYSWRWSSPWYYSGWHYSWYGPRWYGGYWGHYHPHYHYPHYHHPHYAYGGVGGYWGGHGSHGSSAHRPGIHAGRYVNNYRGDKMLSQSASRRSSSSVTDRGRNTTTTGVRQNSNRGTVQRTSGRVVIAKDGNASVRPQRTASGTRTGTTVEGADRRSAGRSNSMYTRPTQGQGSSYSRQSSTRSTVNQQSSTRSRESVTSRSSSSRSSSSRSSYSSSSRSSSSGSFSSGSSSRSSMGGGATRSSGGSSRGGGGRR